MVEESPELVCGLNEAFLGGLLEGLECPDVRLEAEDDAGACCVRLRSEPDAAPPAGSRC
jgi:hypothetical protein